MAANSMAIDRGVPIDVVLDIGRWPVGSLWQVLQPSSPESGGPEHTHNFVGLALLSTLT